MRIKTLALSQPLDSWRVFRPDRVLQSAAF
jgi:hypothetical protein